MRRHIRTAKLDQLGITASVACAIHCAALPFIISSLPLLGLKFLAQGWVEATMICISLVIGIGSLGFSYPQHKKYLPIGVLAAGFLLIGTGHYFLEDFEAVLIPLGGFAIAGAHMINWRYTRTCLHP